MKKWLVALFCFTIILTGCATETPKPKPDTHPDTKPRTSHLSAKQNGLTVEVSNELRTFPENMIAAKEGYKIVGISVTLINETKEDIRISPDYVTLISTDNTEYKYSEITPTVAGKGAFKKLTLPPDYRGGGLLLFEIKKETKISKVNYQDELDHNLNIQFDSDKTTDV